MMMAKHTKFGRKLIAALSGAVHAAETGEMHRLTIREVKLPAPPTRYDATTVRATRDVIGVSQAVFARMLGVSTVLVQSWEQDVRKPVAMACRLLDEINANPRRWRRMLAA
jgi:putative transcriptional regulator